MSYHTVMAKCILNRIGYSAVKFSMMNSAETRFMVQSCCSLPVIYLLHKGTCVGVLFLTDSYTFQCKLFTVLQFLVNPGM